MPNLAKQSLLRTFALTSGLGIAVGVLHLAITTFYRSAGRAPAWEYIAKIGNLEYFILTCITTLCVYFPRKLTFWIYFATSLAIAPYMIDHLPPGEWIPGRDHVLLQLLSKLADVMFIASTLLILLATIPVAAFVAGTTSLRGSAARAKIASMATCAMFASGAVSSVILIGGPQDPKVQLGGIVLPWVIAVFVMWRTARGKLGFRVG